jgi:hypothetical protein
MLRKTLMSFICAFLLSIPGFAQSNELGVLFGTTLSPDTTPPLGVGTCTVINPFCGQTLHTNTGITYEGVLAHRIANARIAALYLEFPIVGSSDRNIRQGNFVQNFSSIFFTPGLKLKLNTPVLKPFLSVGGGFAHFSPSTNGGTLPDQSSTQGAFQVGGGVDLGTPIPHLGFRGEVREFYTGKPDFSSNPHNIFVGGGIVLHF